MTPLELLALLVTAPMALSGIAMSVIIIYDISKTNKDS